jgi:serine-type D-Ala-D-Ala endopeptidase (penicillin-binding protein 7)
LPLPPRSSSSSRRGIAALLAVAFAIVGFGVATGARAAVLIPEKRSDAPKIPIAASSYAELLVIDDASGMTLYAHNATSTHTAASLTKLMTATVFTSTPTNWNGTGNILKADEVGGGRLRVNTGSTLSFRDILYSAIIGSANNAAMALGRLFDGKGVPAFVARMNATARDLGLAKATFADPSGMNPKNQVSAYDIATLLATASKEPETQNAMELQTYSFTLRSPKTAKTIKNTNDLLFTEKDLDITAGKTGYLEESQYNFTFRASPKGEPSKSVTVVVLGAPRRQDSIDAAEALARWAWSAYDWNASPAKTSVALARNLGKGDRGADVLALQKYLNAHGTLVAASGPGSPGKETSLFGDMTRIALKKFQDAHRAEILAPRGAKEGSGYLDATTRAYIQAGAIGGTLASR